MVLDSRASGYDDSVYIDHLHLDRRGAAVLSGDVASILADRSVPGGSGVGWVDLPSFAGRTVNEPTSAVARSRLGASMTPGRASMSGEAPDRPGLPIPSGLLGMLALVAAVEWTISGRHLDFTTVWADDWHARPRRRLGR